MLIFLGDSNLLGWELAGVHGNIPPTYEPNKNLFIDPDRLDRLCEGGLDLCNRPDLAFPKLLSDKLQQEYINCGQGGAGYSKALFLLQLCISKTQLPEDVTVFLGTTGVLRSHFVDTLNQSEFHLFNNCISSTNAQYVDMASKYNANPELKRLLQITATWYNLQAVGHISEICKARGWNFLFHEILPEPDCDRAEYEDMAPMPSPRPFKTGITEGKPTGLQSVVDYMEGLHLSAEGHEFVAEKLFHEYHRLTNT